MVDFPLFEKKISGAAEQGQAYSALVALGEAAGFSSMAIGEIPLAGDYDIQPFLLCDVHHPWVTMYANRDWRAVDPGVDLIRSLKHPVVTWDMMRAAVRKNTRAINMFLESEQLGIEDGINFVYVTPAIHAGFINFVGSKGCWQRLDEYALLKLQQLAIKALLKECSFLERARTDFDIPQLTPRAKEVLNRVAEGYSNKEIAIMDGRSEAAVVDIVSKLYVAFGIDRKISNKRVVLAVLAQNMNLVSVKPLLQKAHMLQKTMEFPS